MIKINLLPPEERGKSAETEAKGGISFDLRIIAPSVVLFISVVVIALWFMSLNNKKNELDQQIEKVTADLARVEAEGKIVKRLEENKTRLKTHLQAIEELDKGRFYWVKVLDVVNEALPELTWISKISDESVPNTPAISIQGTAFSNNRVAEFMMNLGASDLVSNTESITLRSTTTKRHKSQNRSIELVDFNMKVELVQPTQLVSKSVSQPKTKS